MLKDIHNLLLGKPIISSLHVLTLISAIIRKVSPRNEFPSLFQGLSKLQREHHIHLYEGTKPFALVSPHLISIALCKKITLKSQQIDVSIISPVDEPTERCAPILGVLKSTRDARTCAGLLNSTEYSFNKHCTG